MQDAIASQAPKAAPIFIGRLRSLLGVFHNLSIQIKASAASAVLLICLLALGTNAYLTSTKSAEGLRMLSHELEPKLQAFSNVSDGIVATHMKIFRYVSWASNGVSEKLLHPLFGQINSDLAALTVRIDDLSKRTDLSAEERSGLQELLTEWERSKNHRRRRPIRFRHGDDDARANRRQFQNRQLRYR
jgi:predicted ribosomally synthesized peptide with SipW-like signal peptide